MNTLNLQSIMWLITDQRKTKQGTTHIREIKEVMCESMRLRWGISLFYLASPTIPLRGGCMQRQSGVVFSLRSPFIIPWLLSLRAMWCNRAPAHNRARCAARGICTASERLWVNDLLAHFNPQNPSSIMHMHTHIHTLRIAWGRPAAFGSCFSSRPF